MIEFPFPIHPKAAKYRLMSPAELAELGESIKTNGQRHKVIFSLGPVFPGYLIDGRNRWLACQLVGVECQIEKRDFASEEEILELIHDNNDLHRMLTPDEQEANRIEFLEKRRAHALELRKEKKSYREIGEVLGVDAKTAWNDVHRTTVEASTVELPSTVIGKDGKEREASKPRLLISQPNERTSQTLYDEAEARREEKLFTPKVIEAMESFAQEDLSAVSNCGENPVFVSPSLSEIWPTQTFRPNPPTPEEPSPSPQSQAPEDKLVETKKGTATIQPSGFDGWNTPPHIIALLNAFALFGKVSLDPCSNDDSLINAHIELDIVDDGLHADWAAELLEARHEGGLVFVNPPYDMETLTHVAKHCSEQAEKGLEIISLVPNKSDQDWFQDLVMPTASAICYIRGRLKFWRNGEESSGAAMACVLLYWGKDASAFCEMFGGLGRCLDLDLLREAQARASEEEAA